MFVIEEVFISKDEDSRKRRLEDILVSIIKNTKNHEELKTVSRANDLIEKV